MEGTYLKNIQIQFAEYEKDCVLHLYFRDGTDGFIDLNAFADLLPLYSRFRDASFVRSFSLDSGILSWDKGTIDIAPETVYHIATGHPYPDGMLVSDSELIQEEKAMVRKIAD